jgi:glutamyl-tRNA synthetase
MKDTKIIRVRYAPSPTGSQHCGGLRTALFNYLFAKKHGGKFILRIEDTDQKRFVPGAEDYIMRSLYWLGIEPDEHPLNPGNCGPYRQSARKELGIYKEYVQQLLDAGYAYYAFDTESDLNLMRKRQELMKSKEGYNCNTRKVMMNSLTLPASEVTRKLEAKDPYVIRLKVPEKEEIRFHDLILGWIMVESKDIDDKVLMKSDGMPAYHLANVVDDHLMGITHVIRGQEWAPSAPFHILLYKYLGWSDSMPEFAHLPLLMGPNGKLSKRDGNTLGFPIFPLSYTYTNPDTGIEESVTGFKDVGYNPDTLFNFLALMGWSPGDTKEIMCREEIIEKFSLEKVNKSGCLFDPVKLKHFQNIYFKAQDKEELYERFFITLNKSLIDRDIEPALSNKARKVFEMAYERSSFERELLENIDFFFIKPVMIQDTVNLVPEEIVAVILEFPNIIDSEDNGFQIKDKLFALIKTKGLKNGQVLKPLRYIVTGEEHGPELHNIFDTLSKEDLKERILDAFKSVVGN